MQEKLGGQILYHGGLSTETSIDNIDLDRLGAQQNKKGRTYGGFYLTDDTSKEWSEDYARTRNGNLHGFLIKPTARTIEIIDRDIDRLSAEARTNFARDYDVIKGKDLLKRTEYVLLNKEIVAQIGLDNLNETNEEKI